MINRHRLLVIVNTYVGAPPKQRNARSSPITTDGKDLSRNATTRNRDHASHAQNSAVRQPSTTGPSPKSSCPETGLRQRRRVTRRCSRRNRHFAKATHRRVVRSGP
jgi:hypothetical protein